VIDGVRPILASLLGRILGHKVEEALRIQERKGFFICKEVLVEVPGEDEVPVIFRIIKVGLDPLPKEGKLLLPDARTPWVRVGLEWTTTKVKSNPSGKNLP
jgi:hypothetical protein